MDRMPCTCYHIMTRVIDKNSNNINNGSAVPRGTLLVAQLVEALRYKPEGRGFRFPMVLVEFFIDIILPAALWPWG